MLQPEFESHQPAQPDPVLNSNVLKNATNPPPQKKFFFNNIKGMFMKRFSVGIETFFFLEFSFAPNTLRQVQDFVEWRVFVSKQYRYIVTLYTFL